MARTLYFMKLSPILISPIAHVTLLEVTSRENFCRVKFSPMPCIGEIGEKFRMAKFSAHTKNYDNYISLLQAAQERYAKEKTEVYMYTCMH